MNQQQAGWYQEFRSLYWRAGGEAQATRAFGEKVRSASDWNRCRDAVVKQTPEMKNRTNMLRPTAHAFLSADFALLRAERYSL